MHPPTGEGNIQLPGYGALYGMGKSEEDMCE